MFDLKSVRRAFVVAGIVALLDAGAAQSALLELSGFGTPVIDGVISPGEWVSAGQLDFTANTPFGGHTPATLFVMNDASNLYLAVRFERNVLDPGNSMDFEFDNNNDGKAQNGDDLILFNPDLGVLSDEFRTNAPPCPAGSGEAACGFLDSSAGGTNDGAAAFAHNGAFSAYEFSHPLNSGDTGHDFALKPGDRVGFSLFIRMIGQGGTFPSGFGDTDFPAPADVGKILIAVPEPSTTAMVRIGTMIGVVALRRRTHHRALSGTADRHTRCLSG